MKYKLKLRFVTGMKQVLNAVKAKKVKLILLAPDTEINECIDGKIEAVIDLALASEIPVIYCLNRRKLAKACQLSMRQSIVGIFDPDGVYDLYKKIVKFIRLSSET